MVSLPHRRVSRHTSILDRGRHEIPLFDRTTKETIYGLKALTYVLGSRWTWLTPFFESRAFLWMFYPLYQIITYNRRVIAGCKACCGFDCAPDLNRFYRSVYLLIAGMMVGTIGGLLATRESVSGVLEPNTTAVLLLIAFAIVGLIVAMAKRATNGVSGHLGFPGQSCDQPTDRGLNAASVAAVANDANWYGLGKCSDIATLLGLEEMRRRS